MFRSFVELIQLIGKKYYPTRGKSIDELINRINNKSFSKIKPYFLAAIELKIASKGTIPQTELGSYDGVLTCFLRYSNEIFTLIFEKATFP